MAKKDDDLLMLIGIGEEESVFKTYVDTLVNGKLAALKHTPQHGAKQGESLFTHLVNGVFVLERLRPLVGLTDEATRVLFAAYTVHDLNKLPLMEGQEVPFNTLASMENVDRALVEWRVEDFFPDYADYLPDIWHLVRAHSRHYSTAAESLDKSFNPYRLGRQLLECLVPLIRAADIIDLSHTLEERRHKAAFLKELNTVTDKQYEFVTHKVVEARGILTNLLHNAIVDYLKDKDLTPLLFYPDGVTYLQDRAHPISITETDIAAIGQCVVETMEGKAQGDLSIFIKNTSQGIKVPPICLTRSFRDIFREVRNVIMGIGYTKSTASKPARYETMTESIRSRVQKKLAAPKGKKAADAERLRAIAEEALATTIFTLPPDDDTLRLGELVRSYYIFLKDHLAKQVPNAWARIYDLLDISSDAWARYEIYDIRYDRPYILGKDLRAGRQLTFADAYALICEDGSALMGDREMEASKFAALADYVARYVTFSGVQTNERDFGAALLRYVDRNHVQCSVCGSEFETGLWRKKDVPANVKVQQFSNRLEGGNSRDPVRNVCEICRAQFLLDKLTYTAVGDKTRTYFVHLYPYSFFTAYYINAFRRQLDDWRGANVSSVLLKVDEVYKGFRETGQLAPRFAPTKVNGTPVPTFSEIIGNVITEPINAPGDNDTERFMFALENALVLKLFMGCRATLTDSDIPLFADEEAADFLIDNVPPAFRGLLPTNSLTWEQTRDLWKTMNLLHQIKSLIFDPKGSDPMVALVRVLDDDPLELFAVTHRLIGRKSKAEQEQLRFGLLRNVCPLVADIVRRKGGEIIVGYIQDLAHIAWDAKLKGDSLKDNSLAKPLDVAFDVLERWDPEKESEGEIRALLRKEIAETIERVTDPKYWGQTKIQRIAEFVDILWEKVFKEVHKGRINDLLERRRRIRSTFIQFVADEIVKKKKEDK